MKDTERHNYIGDHIRKLREEKGWTQQVLGKKLGKKTSTISAYETNAKLPSVDCLIEMAELFDVSLDTLVYGDRSNLISIRALRPEQKELISELTRVFSARHTTAEQRLELFSKIVSHLSQEFGIPILWAYRFFNCLGVATGAVFYSCFMTSNSDFVSLLWK